MRRSVVVFLVILASACSSAERTQQQAITRGDAYVSQKKFTEATLEYRRALQAQAGSDPRTGAVYDKLGDAYVAAGDPKSALPAYVRAADLAPASADVQLKAGNLL